MVSETGVARFEGLGGGFTALFFSSSSLRLSQVTDFTHGGSFRVARPAWSSGDQLSWAGRDKARWWCLNDGTSNRMARGVGKQVMVK